MNFGDSPDHSRRCDRAPSDVELLVRRTEVRQHRMEIDLFGRPTLARRLHEEIVDPRPLPDRRREQKPASTGRGQHRLGHEARRERRDHRVVRIAAGAQHILRRRDGQGMAGGNDAAHDSSDRRFIDIRGSGRPGRTIERFAPRNDSPRPTSILLRDAGLCGLAVQDRATTRHGRCPSFSVRQVAVCSCSDPGLRRPGARAAYDTLRKARRHPVASAAYNAGERV